MATSFSEARNAIGRGQSHQKAKFAAATPCGHQRRFDQSGVASGRIYWIKPTAAKPPRILGTIARGRTRDLRPILKIVCSRTTNFG
jgi:hypothetical protein